MLDEKPKYGWYVRGLIIGFTFVGLIGLILFMLGYFLQGFWGIILIISGMTIIFIFLWPGLGMIIMHLALLTNVSIVDKMTMLKELDNPQILDVGCGTGRTALRIAKELEGGGHLFGIDIYEKLAISGNALKTVQNNARIEGVVDKTTFQFGSATEIPFEDNKFNIVNISSVLHEVHDPSGKEKSMKELYRVLKPGGTLYFSEWNRKSWKCIAFMGLCCFVFKRKDYWYNLLKKHNFKEISYNEMSGFGLFIAKK